MGAHILKITTAPGDATKAEDAATQLRIRAEFAELPGLKLTLPQASRLFHLDVPRCKRILGDLVDRGQLIENHGTFERPAA